MRNVGPEKLDTKRVNLIDCNHAAKADFSLDSGALSNLIEDGDETEVRYQKLRNYARETFFGIHTFKTNHIRGASESGFDIVTELLGIAPHAYRHYGQEHDIELSLEGLNEALKRSEETPRRLMNLPDDVNSEVEINLGLRRSFGIASEEDDTEPFRFEPTGRGPLFIIDDDLFAALSEPLVYKADTPEHWQRCPARRLVLARIWPAMIDLATDTPEIFAHDLDMLDTGRDG